MRGSMSLAADECDKPASRQVLEIIIGIDVENKFLFFKKKRKLLHLDLNQYLLYYYDAHVFGFGCLLASRKTIWLFGLHFF